MAYVKFGWIILVASQNIEHLIKNKYRRDLQRQVQELYWRILIMQQILLYCRQEAHRPWWSPKYYISKNDLSESLVCNLSLILSTSAWGQDRPSPPPTTKYVDPRDPTHFLLPRSSPHDKVTIQCIHSLNKITLNNKQKNYIPSIYNTTSLLTSSASREVLPMNIWWNVRSNYIYR